VISDHFFVSFVIMSFLKSEGSVVNQGLRQIAVVFSTVLSWQSFLSMRLLSDVHPTATATFFF
jgi:hypothetical protein